MEEADAGQEGEAAADAPTVVSLDLSNVRGFQVMPSGGEAVPDAMDEETRRRELAKEFAARAARFAEAVDDAIVLANDGTIRWLGDPVAKLISGDETLTPRAVILADDALPAEGREAAQHRLALWLTAHIRKALGPLLALLEPESVPEGVRDLALKLSQALGILERERVKAQVKALDQNARGALRKLGVRFGAHYVYIPALLKPAARALSAQLWALSRGEADKEAVAEKLLHFASSGRTSFAVDGPASGEVYRVAGFRLCGERAVRVDIVERLTDLIRAALPRHATADPAPAGEASLVGFVVTNQMTSLTGCSGEHFASILRSLGFASHQVNKSAYLAAQKAAQPSAPASVEPATTSAPEAAADAAPTPEDEAVVEAPEPQGEEQASAETPAPPEEQAIVAMTAEAAADAPERQGEEQATADTPAPPEEQAVVATTAETPETVALEVAEPAVPVEPVSAEDAPTEAALSSDEDPPAEASEETPDQQAPSAAEGAASVDDELIEIWRPAPRRARPAGREHGRPHRQGHATPAEGRGSHDGQPRKPWRDRPRPQAAQGQQGGGEAETQAAARPAPSAEPSREGRRQPWRRDGAKGPRPEQNRNGEAGADKAKARPQPEPRKPSVNLDSPFAKLLDLKPLLKSRDTAK